MPRFLLAMIILSSLGLAACSVGGSGGSVPGASQISPASEHAAGPQIIPVGPRPSTVIQCPTMYNWCEPIKLNQALTYRACVSGTMGRSCAKGAPAYSWTQTITWLKGTSQAKVDGSITGPNPGSPTYITDTQVKSTGTTGYVKLVQTLEACLGSTCVTGKIGLYPLK